MSTLDVKSVSVIADIQKQSTPSSEATTVTTDELSQALSNNHEGAWDVFEKVALGIGAPSLIVCPLLSVLDDIEENKIRTGKKVVDLTIHRGLFKKGTKVKSNCVDLSKYMFFPGTKFAKIGLALGAISLACLTIAGIHDYKRKHLNG